MKGVIRIASGSRASNNIDDILMFVAKILYLSARVILRYSVSKQRRIKLARDFAFSSIVFKLRPGSGLVKFRSTKYGFDFFCGSNDDFKVMTSHEEAIIDLFRPKKGDTVIDIGAHLGLYSILASRKVGESGKVIAIEASPTNFDILNSNIGLNGLSNVVTVNSAVYSSNGRITLYLPGKESLFTKYNTVMPNRSGAESSIEVDSCTLDDLLESKGVKKVNWMKIDVEGAEYEVLKGARHILTNSSDISILIEVHKVRGNQLYDPIYEMLYSLGCKVTFQDIYPSGERHVIFRKIS